MSAAPNWDRVKQAFQEVLEQPEPERAARVRELCGDDAALQAEVESMLATHGEAGSFGEQPALDLLNAIGIAADTSASSGPDRLRPGARLGVYEVQSLVGAGGMGEVYKARDSRLDRIVAIKVLPGTFAADRDRYQRFEREARAIARLDHPRIGALYDVGEHGGLRFLVMQYLEGETLAARLAKGPLPLADVLRYAIDILEALDHAHRRGIVHRDLKPGNIVLTKSGAKLLDFGLAKWRATPAGSVSAPTVMPDSITEAGMIVGTLHYMAPEQVEGKDADARSDLFSFGTVAYEMLTGKKAFDGGSPASVMATILSAQPPSLSALQPLTPPALDHVVMSCLAKDPDARWQSAADVARQLRWVSEWDTHAQPAATAAVARSHRRGVLRVGLVALFVGVAIGGAALRTVVRLRETTPSLKVTRAVIPLPPGTRLSSDSLVGAIAISPDGRTIAVAADVGSGSQLYIRALDWSVATPIVGTNGAGAPFFSPDGHWVGFNVGGQIKKVAISGGAPQVVRETAGRSAFGAAWNEDGMILFSGRRGAGLSRVSANGGAPVIVTTPDVSRREKSHRRPALLPGGKSVLMTVGTADIMSWDDAHIDVLTLATGQRKTVIQGGMDGQYVSTGHLIYARAGSLLAVPFDLSRLEVTGPPVTVVSDVFTQPDFGYANFGVSRDGTLLYMPGGARPWRTALMWVDRQGRSQPVTDVRRAFGDLSLSPDGGRIALQIDQATAEVWVYDLSRMTFTRLVHGWDNGAPLWSRDGARIAFESTRSTSHGLFWQAADGTGHAERLTPDVPSSLMWPESWSPDGRQLVYTQYNASGDTDLWVWSAADHQARPLLQTPASESDARISPDGGWIAYQSNQSGRFDVYVQAFPGPSRSWPVSPDGGTNPVWSRNGRELFYRNGNMMMAVDVVTTPTFAASWPKRLFEASYLQAYDVARDGRFLMIKDEPEPLTQLILVQNWLEELKRRVPRP